MTRHRINARLGQINILKLTDSDKDSRKWKIEHELHSEYHHKTEKKVGGGMGRGTAKFVGM